MHVMLKVNLSHNEDLITVNHIIFSSLGFSSFTPYDILVSIKFSERAEYCNVQTRHRWTIHTSHEHSFADGFPTCSLNSSCIDGYSIVLANLGVKLKIAVGIHATPFFPVPRTD